MADGIVATDDIASIALRGVALVESHDLRDALAAAYQSPQGVEAVETAHRVFRRLTASSWPVETLCRFLSGWRSTHGTALFVGGLIIRLHRLAREIPSSSRPLLHEAAAEMGEVISEDTGVADTPHSELFARFANRLAGDDRWLLGRYGVPACDRFRGYIKETRLAASVEEAILTTAASENWNTGEFTYFSILVRPWMIDVLGHAADIVDRDTAYVTVHAGETELGHFLKALRAWQFYCQATGQTADPMKARHALECYLQQIGNAFAGLEHVLGGRAKMGD